MRKRAALLAAALLAGVVFGACGTVESTSLPFSSQPSLPENTEISTPEPKPDDFMAVRPHLGTVELEGDELLKAQAMVLAEHLTRFCLTDFAPQGERLREEDIHAFMVTLAFYYDEPYHPYREVVTEVEWSTDGGRYIDKEAFNDAAWQLFGVENYLANAADEFEGREAEFIPFGVGPPYGRFAMVEPQTVFDREAGTIEVVFEMVNNMYVEEGDSGLGTHQIVFTIVEEETGRYLRFWAFE